MDCRNVYVLTCLSGRRSIFVHESLRKVLDAEFGDHNRYRLTYINLDAGMEDSTVLTRLKEAMREEDVREYKPDLFIVYGDFLSESLAQDTSAIFRNTPTVCMGVIFPEHKGILLNRKNVTGFKMEIDIRANLRLMEDMHCERWVVTSLDTGYIDQYLRAQFRRDLALAKSDYRFNEDLLCPDHYQSRSVRDTSVITIIPICTADESLNYTNRAEGRGFSWSRMFCCMNAQVTYVRLKSDPLADNAFKLSLGRYYAAVPDFFNSGVIDFMSVNAGGYLCPFSEMAREVHPVVDGILFSNLSPHSIPWSMHENDYWLDWKVVQHMYHYASDCPPYVHFVNLPWMYRSRVHYWVWNTALPWFLLIVLVIGAFIPIRLYLVRKKVERNIEKQGREAEELTGLMTDIMSVTGAYLWRLIDGRLSLNNLSVQHNDIKRSEVPLAVFYRYLHEEDAHKLQALLQRSTDEVSELELSMLSPVTGHLHYLHVCVSRVHNVMGNPYASGMFFVIDRQKERQRDIREAYEQEEKSHLKETFLASMGHEIRTPLNAIVGFSRVLIEERSNLSQEELASICDVINKNNDQLLELLNGVINFSVEAENSMKPVLQEINVAGLMDELYMTHSVIVPSHLRFELVRGDADACIMSSRTNMRQVVSNMMNNACKFTKEGSITMGWEATDDTVCIYVEDTGMGVKEEDQERIFSKFYKTDSTTEGAGIGLPLCKKLVTGMGGTIGVKSTYGKGSRFEVRLPRVERKQILASEVS
jgi:signal transduction histidine kinase